MQGLSSNQWNGQLRPLLNTTVRGIWWYQGEDETNLGQDGVYACRFEKMMDAWRDQWHVGTAGATDPNMPFGIVQIGPCGGTPGPAGEKGQFWPTGKSEFVFDVRMGQTAGFGYAPNERWPHTFLATAFDLANPPGTNGKDGPVSVTTQWFV
jgi:hypothetical protein